ncbi:hypothetical protein CVT26_011215 [Gymnopilus dilepis]|uniref:Uncharacterized protein n=1 Tax=Gymnopilus dilepis TaxID=231916 RepID=A0A409VJQ8_9AGAR|nr:hypothetical protein CVT26_011215 [Gymnopilus dilepis]
MIRIFEEDSHPFPSPHFRSPRHIATMATGKRARSPESGSPGDRPSKRLSLAVTDVNRRTIYRKMSSTPSSSRHPSEDWVQQAGGLRIDSPVYPPSEPFITPPPGEDVEMVLDSEDVAPAQINNVLEIGELPAFLAGSSSSFSHPQPPSVQEGQAGAPNTPRHNYATRYSERMQAPTPLIPPHINVLPPTPMNGHQLGEQPPQAQAIATPPILPDSGFVFAPTRPSTPPPSSPVPMAISPTNSLSQLAPSSPKMAKRRIVFGPRSNCDKCRRGEKHFIHFEDYSTA